MLTEAAIKGKENMFMTDEQFAEFAKNIIDTQSMGVMERSSGVPIVTPLALSISQILSAICKANSKSWVERKIVLLVERDK